MMLPNPREDNEGTKIYIWHPRIASPDKNPFETPHQCVEHLFRCVFDDSARKLAQVFLDDKHLLSLMRIVRHANNPTTISVETRSNRNSSWINEYSWIVQDDEDETEGIQLFEDELFELVADQVDALSLLKHYIPLRTVHVLEHGIVRFSTSAFADSWDSSACGIAFVEPDGDLISQIDYDAACALLDAEVKEYDMWANDEYDENEDWSNTTNLICPKCGQSAEFSASEIVLSDGKCRISPTGWDYTGLHHADFSDNTRITCEKCQHADSASAFQV